jgi:hypothetical protein
LQTANRHSLDAGHYHHSRINNRNRNLSLKEKPMTREDQIKIKQEFDKSIKYLSPRRDAGTLTIGECMQEIGTLRLFIFNMPTRRETIIR